MSFYDHHYKKLFQYDNSRVEIFAHTMAHTKKLSPYEEKMEILNSSRKTPEENIRKRTDSIYFVISKKWYESWKKYVQYSDVDAKEAGTSHRPGKIDNLPLISNSYEFVQAVEKKIENNDIDLPLVRLKRCVVKNVDFEVVNTDVWEKLYTWYGGSTSGYAPAIARLCPQFEDTYPVYFDAPDQYDLYPVFIMCAYLHKLENCFQFKEFRFPKKWSINRVIQILMGFYQIFPRLSICRVADIRLWCAKAGGSFSKPHSYNDRISNYRRKSSIKLEKILEQLEEEDSSEKEEQNAYFFLLEPRFLTEKYLLSCCEERMERFYDEHSTVIVRNNRKFEIVPKAKTSYISISPPDLETTVGMTKYIEKKKREYDTNQSTWKKDNVNPLEGRSYRTEYIKKTIDMIWKSEEEEENLEKTNDLDERIQSSKNWTCSTELVREGFRIEMMKETYVYCRSFLRKKIFRQFLLDGPPAEIYIIQLLPGVSKDIDEKERKEYAQDMEYDLSGVEFVEIVGCIRMKILKILI